MHTINVLLLQRMHKQFFLRHFFKQRSSYRDCVCVQTPVTSLKKSKDKLIMLINITNHLHYTQGLHYIFINTSLQTSLSWSSFSIEFTREVEDEAWLPCRLFLLFFRLCLCFFGDPSSSGVWEGLGGLADDSLVSCSVSCREELIFDICDVSSVSESTSCREQSAPPFEALVAVDVEVSSVVVVVDLWECLDVLEELFDTLDALEDSTLPWLVYPSSDFE